jgi:hypothetical protein
MCGLERIPPGGSLSERMGTVMKTTLFGLALAVLIVLACPKLAAAVGLDFSGDTRDIYFAGLAAESGPCYQLCGFTAPCYGFVSISGNSLSLWAHYEPGGCVYCGCCGEGRAFATGVIRVVLYVDPVTGKPLSKFSGGRPVVENIPSGSTLNFPLGSARVTECDGSWCDKSCYGFAHLVVANQSAIMAFREPICGGSSDISSVGLTGNGAPFIAWVGVSGNSCSAATAVLQLDGVTVHVLADSIFPDPGESSSRPFAIDVQNKSVEPWSNVTVRMYGRNGSPMDSTSVAQLAPFTSLRWIVNTPSGATIRVQTQAAPKSAPVPTLSPEYQAFTVGSGSPHILVEGTSGTGSQTAIISYSAGFTTRARVGEVRGVLDRTGIIGTSLVPLNPPVNITDEFTSPSPDPAWTVDNPSSPESRVTTAERPGYLRIVATQSGDGADYWLGSNLRAPVILQAPKGDWELETKLEFAPSDEYEGAGVWLDGRVAERAFGSAGQQVSCIGAWVPFSATTTYFRIVKKDSTLTGYYSADGINWNLGGTANRVPKSIGLYAVRKNWNPGGDHDAVADFDYLRIDPRLRLRFEGNTAGEFGETATAEGGLRYEWGSSGRDKGVYIPPNGELRYSSGTNIVGSSGTVDFWIKPAWDGNDGRHHYVLSLGEAGGILIGKDSANFWRIILNRYAANSLPELGGGLDVSGWKSGEWHYAAFTWDQSAIKVYVDGALCDSVASVVPPPPVNAPELVIGSDNSTNQLNGVLDDLTIRERALTGDEIRTRYSRWIASGVELGASGSGPLALRLVSPNPLSGAGAFMLRIDRQGKVRVDVIDVRGRRVKTLVNGTLAPGEHRIDWNAAGRGGKISAGVYWLVARNEREVAKQRLVVVR